MFDPSPWILKALTTEGGHLFINHGGYCLDYENDHQLMRVYEALGVAGAIDWTPDTLLRALNAQSARIKLTAGITLQRVYVMGRARIEVTGFQASDLSHFKALGCFTEIISWKTRLFIPIDDMRVFVSVLSNHNVKLQEAA
jgi:hypothetical protein